MFENVTAQTRDDAQGNWHNPAHDMLRGSIAMDRLRCIAVADFESGGMSPRQKELFASMPVTRRLLRLRDVAKYKAVEAADEDPSRSMKFFSTIGKPRRFGILPASEVALQQWMSNWTNQVEAVSSALLQMLCSCLASSRRTPAAGTISMWNAVRTASAAHKCARVGTWIKYCWDPTHRPEERRFGCVRMIFRCVDDQLIILIQCAQFSGVYVGVGGSTAQRIVLLDEFAILKEPDTLSSIRSVPVHHDCPRSAARCRCASINLDPLQIVHSRRDVNYFLDPNLATANTW
jgi:hypothetical protein